MQGPASAPEPVRLPHDVLISLERSAESDQGGHVGYFPGGVFEYAKTFDVPEEYRNKRVTVEFQGAYRDAMVYVNRAFAGQRPFGYSTFDVPLDPYLEYGAKNTIRVEARAHKDSRWYSGAGLHRDTALIVTELVHITRNGVRITTLDVDESRAVVEVETTVQNEGVGTARTSVTTELHDPAGRIVATDTAPITLRPGAVSVARQRLFVGQPERWDVDSPVLYAATSTLRTVGNDIDGTAIDAQRTSFGIRTLQLDPDAGLRINGNTVKLRGACIHHDNGILGAAAIGRAEERRVELLKAAGFNAIRSSHNPLSQAMLDACDRIGMLVMDETFDVWTEGKSPFDYSLAFPEWWERDVEAMVAKDFNHPSVIFYSIGNEIFETGTPLGSDWGRRIAEKVRSLDRSRYITNGINGFVSVLPEVTTMMQQRGSEPAGVNATMGEAGDFMNQVSSSELVTEKTAESFAVLDVAGMNYGDGRYEMDRELFPNRIIVGTETFPSHIDTNWRLVEDNPHVIGDFTWTGWDYLGEAGIGRMQYLDEGETPQFSAPYPWLLAWCGDIDITGHRRPASYYRETVFGLRHEPYIAVQRPEHHGQARHVGQWTWSDSISSWSWDVAPGTPVTVEVYSDADEVELMLNGRSVGQAPVGRGNAFRAQLELEFEPGELVVIARVGATETGRSVLRSASSDLRLVVEADRPEIRGDDSDLAFVAIELRDGDGNLANHADRPITVSVEGAGTLQALGSARPNPVESYTGKQHTSFDGRLLAAIRPYRAGSILVRVSADGVEPAELTLLSTEARVASAQEDEVVV